MTKVAEIVGMAAMLHAEGCRTRRERLWRALAGRWPENTPIVLADPLHLRYLAGFWVDPFHLGADFGGVLLLRPDGHTTLYHDTRLPADVTQAHVDERVPLTWYDGQSPGQGPRRLMLHPAVVQAGGRIHDALGDPLAPLLHTTLADLRRTKDPDEIELLRQCMAATAAGHHWARQNVRPGMTELEVHQGIWKACVDVCGRAVVVYGDFAVSPGMSRRGGPPTRNVLQTGDLLILDFSVVLGGYRSDFTNTLAVGGRPTAEQQRLFDHCILALQAGEAQLRAGQACQTVYDAVRQVFDAVGLAGQFPHHAGHGLGLSHPEAPFFVRQSHETLRRGDVVTLEPGVYVEGVGGIRIEHNYLVTDTGFERLSPHTIALV